MAALSQALSNVALAGVTVTPRAMDTAEDDADQAFFAALEADLFPPE